MIVRCHHPVSVEVHRGVAFISEFVITHAGTRVGSFMHPVVVALKKEGGVSRETSNRDSHRCHHLLFDDGRTRLEPVVVR